MNNSYKKKLIEVALPLPEINDASAYDKMPGIGPHPKGIHHWWARLPLPTARAVLFASVVDDPESHPEKWPTEELQNAERERLFQIIRELMAKRLHEQPEVYAKVHAEMLAHCDGRLPSVFDPFAGGGTIPLEANRLGFETYAGDLNPVAVLLNKCNLELAPRWNGHPPVNPDDRGKISASGNWHGTHGLAADVRYYGRVILERARQKIGYLYPKVQLPESHGGGQANVIAWLWARTVASPDPSAQRRHVPLLSTYSLSAKGTKGAWLKPIIDKSEGSYHFEVQEGIPKDRAAILNGTKIGRAGFRCLLTGTPISFDYIRNEAQKNGLGAMMTAIIAETSRGRIYLSADRDHIATANSANPINYPDSDLPDEALGFRIQNYGIRHHWQMFTARQLTAMVTFSDLIKAVGSEIADDAMSYGMSPTQSKQYAIDIQTFLALVLDRCASFNNAFCRWNGNQTVFIFTRAAIPMLWDFSEANILGERAVSWHTAVEIVAEAIETIESSSEPGTSVSMQDAAKTIPAINTILVSTDPPYYDNIGYAALSDFFYVWLRRTIGELYPDIFHTMLVPKLPELTASPERFNGSKERAKEHFEAGFKNAFTNLKEMMDQRFPLTVYYAFRQADEPNDIAEIDGPVLDLTTGWETLLEALLSSGFQITATWPVRASFSWRMRALGSNALASYIVLACRPRSADATRISSLQFRQELKSALPSAVKHLQQGNVAPVDFAQAVLGPGMAIYSRYSSILESGGSKLSVRTALGLINQILTEVLDEQADEFDGETRWAIAWFEQYGFTSGPFGDAELLSKAKVTTDSMLQRAGLIVSGANEVRLKKPEDFPAEWSADQSQRTVWGMTHHLIRVYYHDKAGDEATAALLRHFSTRGDLARDLALRLFRIAEKKGMPTEAQAYNALGLGWSEIARLAQKMAPPAAEQGRLI